MDQSLLSGGAPSFGSLPPVEMDGGTLPGHRSHSYSATLSPSASQLNWGASTKSGAGNEKCSSCLLMLCCPFVLLAKCLRDALAPKKKLEVEQDSSTEDFPPLPEDEVRQIFEGFRIEKYEKDIWGSEGDGRFLVGKKRSNSETS